MLKWFKTYYLHTYFISYFRPKDGFFNITIPLPEPIRYQEDIRAIELAIMDGVVPQSEEDVITIISVVQLDKQQIPYHEYLKRKVK